MDKEMVDLFLKAKQIKKSKQIIVIDGFDDRLRATREMCLNKKRH